MIVIVDYKMGNIGSILNMLRKLGVEARSSDSSADILQANKLILPGVGAFDSGMANIHRLGLYDAIQHQALQRRIPILGICLGMQLLTRRSEEGMAEGLNWIRAETVRFHFEQTGSVLKVPHMGWNTVVPTKQHPLIEGINMHSRFYFVHSYHVRCEFDRDVALTTHHGYDFASAIQCDNIMGVQFHPEKSHKFGLQLLDNFSRL